MTASASPEGLLRLLPTCERVLRRAGCRHPPRSTPAPTGRNEVVSYRGRFKLRPLDYEVAPTRCVRSMVLYVAWPLDKRGDKLRIRLSQGCSLLATTFLHRDGREVRVHPRTMKQAYRDALSACGQRRCILKLTRKHKVIDGAANKVRSEKRKGSGFGFSRGSTGHLCDLLNFRFVLFCPLLLPRITFGLIEGTDNGFIPTLTHESCSLMLMMLRHGPSSKATQRHRHSKAASMLPGNKGRCMHASRFYLNPPQSLILLHFHSFFLHHLFISRLL